MFFLVDIIEMIRVASYEVGGSKNLMFRMSSAINNYIRRDTGYMGHVVVELEVVVDNGVICMVKLK